jgi:hypothetical protein
VSTIPHLDDIVAAAEAAVEAAKAPTLLLPEDPEPRHGSIVLITSDTGTAAQRFYSDGLWHVATGEVVDSYAGLFLRSDGRPRDVYLVWQAPEWDDKRPRYLGGTA